VLYSWSRRVTNFSSCSSEIRTDVTSSTLAQDRPNSLKVALVRAAGTVKVLEDWKCEVPKREKVEVLAAFAAHKDEVTAGYVGAAKPR
jgi:hypothetical protein